MVELYFTSSIRLHGLVLNHLSPEESLPVTYIELGWPAFIIFMGLLAASMNSGCQSYFTYIVNKVGKCILHNTVHKISDDIISNL
jgi:hypothetical protein